MYIVNDKFAYDVPPNWSFEKSVRNTLDVKPKYEYYHRSDVEFVEKELDAG